MNGRPADRKSSEAAAYRLVLFVAGDEKNSRIARDNLRRLCDEDLGGEASVEIVDVLSDIKAAAENNILLTPSLLVVEPKPETVVIGNLSDRKRVRGVLGLLREKKAS